MKEFDHWEMKSIEMNLDRDQSIIVHLQFHFDNDFIDWNHLFKIYWTLNDESITSMKCINIKSSQKNKKEIFSEKNPNDQWRQRRDLFHNWSNWFDFIWKASRKRIARNWFWESLEENSWGFFNDGIQLIKSSSRMQRETNGKEWKWNDQLWLEWNLFEKRQMTNLFRSFSLRIRNISHAVRVEMIDEEFDLWSSPSLSSFHNQWQNWSKLKEKETFFIKRLKKRSHLICWSSSKIEDIQEDDHRSVQIESLDDQCENGWNEMIKCLTRINIHWHFHWIIEQIFFEFHSVVWEVFSLQRSLNSMIDCWWTFPLTLESFPWPCNKSNDHFNRFGLIEKKRTSLEKMISHWWWSTIVMISSMNFIETMWKLIIVVVVVVVGEKIVMEIWNCLDPTMTIPEQSIVHLICVQELFIDQEYRTNFFRLHWFFLEDVQSEVMWKFVDEISRLNFGWSIDSLNSNYNDFHNFPIRLICVCLLLLKKRQFRLVVSLEMSQKCRWECCCCRFSFLSRLNWFHFEREKKKWIDQIWLFF